LQVGLKNDARQIVHETNADNGPPLRKTHVRARTMPQPMRCCNASGGKAHGPIVDIG
jgi:hypothetical protein